MNISFGFVGHTYMFYAPCLPETRSAACTRSGDVSVPSQMLLTGCTTEGGNGEFNLPWGIVLSDTGQVYVADSGNRRIQRFGDIMR